MKIKIKTINIEKKYDSFDELFDDGDMYIEEIIYLYCHNHKNITKIPEQIFDYKNLEFFRCSGNQITEIPVSVMNDEIFINLLIKSDKFTLDFARDASEEQKDVIASLPDAYNYARYNKTQVLKAIANESLQEVLKKRFPGLYQVVRKTQPAAALPNDPNATISRQKAMQLLRMRPNDRFHNLEADELGIGSTITMAQFRDVQEEFSRRLMGETVQDYIEEKYMMMMDNYEDDGDNFGY